MKDRIAKKDVKAMYGTIIKVPYCNLQELLTFEDPKYYNCGTYGWNFDVYLIDSDTAIVTGYRPFGNVTPAYEVTRKYEEKAREIKKDWRWVTDYDGVRDRMRNLIAEFVKEVCENG